MTGGLETTFKVLATTKNEAAIHVLIAGLEMPDRAVQADALRALVDRRSAAGHRELLRRWPSFGERWKAIVAERAGRISGAVRDAILGADADLRVNGCDAAQWTRDFDLIPVLIAAAEDRSNPQADLASQSLLSLSECLGEELAAPRDYRIRRDPQTVRRCVMRSLEKSVLHFEQHKRAEIVEAFLLLVRRQNTILRRILQSPHDKAYLAIVNLLTHSPRPGVMRLLTDFLEDPRTLTTIQNVLARRRDVPFLRHLLKRVSGDLTANVKANVRRIDSFVWLRDDLAILSALNDDDQTGAVQLTLASGMDRLRAFEVLKFILQHGGSEARLAAAQALAQFRGVEANELLLSVLTDDDPRIQAISVQGLRERGIPGAMNMLLDLVDSPHEPVRRSARACLTEFRFARFLETFDMLEEEVRRNAGELVKRVDANAVAALLDELRAVSRSRRRRGVEMAAAMGAVAEVEDELIKLLGDKDPFVRAEAMRALAGHNSPRTRRALRELLLDQNVVVRRTAERVLQSFATGLLSANNDEAASCDGSESVQGVDP